MTDIKSETGVFPHKPNSIIMDDIRPGSIVKVEEGPDEDGWLLTICRVDSLVGDSILYKKGVCSFLSVEELNRNVYFYDLDWKYIQDYVAAEYIHTDGEKYWSDPVSTITGIIGPDEFDVYIKYFPEL